MAHIAINFVSPVYCGSRLCLNTFAFVSKCESAIACGLPPKVSQCALDLSSVDLVFSPWQFTGLTCLVCQDLVCFTEGCLPANEVLSDLFHFPLCFAPRLFLFSLPYDLDNLRAFFNSWCEKRILSLVLICCSIVIVVFEHFKFISLKCNTCFGRWSCLVGQLDSPPLSCAFCSHFLVLL